MTYPASGVMLPRCTLGLYYSTYPAGGVAPSRYALALYDYIQKSRDRLRMG
jgi:hypothetical protein